MKGLITNEWDRDNLNFLLNTKGDEFKAWHAQASEDDLIYAQELMDAYSRELQLKSQDLEVECLLQKNNGNYPEAKRVIDALMKR